ncbi:MAG: hypothetical protein JXD22_13375 [Sedimentisphaerales bacterium]|nr:hypothetical protein [Sedimentisphaerales bacterium]
MVNASQELYESPHVFSRKIKTHQVYRLTIVFVLLCVSTARSDILYRNSGSVSENESTYAAWLDDVGITEDQLQYLVDFETGFTEGQNISGIAGLFSGGLIITDSSSTNAAIIRSSSSYFGGSYPVGTFSVAHNEKAYLELDFTAQPVDYVSFQDIDHAGTTVYVDFIEGPSVSFSVETTNTSGTSAEFIGIFHNDMPMISKVRLDASGDGEWGIDTIRYGVVSPCIVDLTSFAKFATEWLCEGPGFAADLSHNEQVALEDLALLVELWLQPCPPDWPL